MSASCGKCQAEEAWAGQRQSFDILCFVLTRISRETANRLLIDIGQKWGLDIEKALRADLNSYLEIRRIRAAKEKRA